MGTAAHHHAGKSLAGGVRALERVKGRDREPVYILVVKNTKLAKVIHEWIAEDKTPAGLPPARLEQLRNRDGRTVTIRVDSKVVKETNTDGAKGR